MKQKEETAMDPLELLRERFGFNDFRPGQRPVIEALLAGKPALAVFPTGGGKSLCYQLPALAQQLERVHRRLVFLFHARPIEDRCRYVSLLRPDSLRCLALRGDWAVIAGAARGTLVSWEQGDGQAAF
jgi:hypothetical protein